MGFNNNADELINFYFDFKKIFYQNEEGEIKLSKYQETFDYSLSNPKEFWSKAAEDVVWIKKFENVIHTDGPPFYKWFKGGKINTCYNALDRHIDEGNGDRIALIYDSAMTNTKKKFTYTELRDKTAELAGALQRFGIKK